jgi:hypothetical protein
MRPVIHTGRVLAYRLDASSRYSASSSALAALSTWPVPSQRLAHQMVPPIAFGTVQICQFGQIATTRSLVLRICFPRFPTCPPHGFVRQAGLYIARRPRQRTGLPHTARARPAEIWPAAAGLFARSIGGHLARLGPPDQSRRTESTAGSELRRETAITLSNAGGQEERAHSRRYGWQPGRQGGCLCRARTG